MIEKTDLQDALRWLRWNVESLRSVQGVRCVDKVEDYINQEKREVDQLVVGLADNLYVSQPTIRRWAKGNNLPHPVIAKAITDAAEREEGEFIEARGLDINDVLVGGDWDGFHVTRMGRTIVHSSFYEELLADTPGIVILELQKVIPIPPGCVGIDDPSYQEVRTLRVWLAADEEVRVQR